MHCSNKISHVVREGDTVYLLAKEYDITVNRISALNPYINPYNLQIGSTLFVCPGRNWIQVIPKPPVFPKPPIGVVPPIYPPISNCPLEDCRCCFDSVISRMRFVWLQHIYWTRLLIISIVERLKDQDATAVRLLQNPNDMAAIFANYYPADVAQNIAKLFTEHLQIGGELITVLRDGKKAETTKLDKEWYINADKIAAYFASINPEYNYQELKIMMYSHLDLTKKEVAARLAGNYAADIEAFGKVEQEAIMMADYFSKGLKCQDFSASVVG